MRCAVITVPAWMLAEQDSPEMDLISSEKTGRRDVFIMRSPRTTVSTDAFEAPTPIPPAPPENNDRGEVFGDEGDGTPSTLMR